MVKEFCKHLVEKGEELDVITVEGKATAVKLMLSRKLDHLKIKAGGTNRKLMMKTVQTLHIGNPPELSDLETPLDQSCVTLEFVNGECLTFRMNNQRQTNDFALGLQILIEAQQ